MILIKKQVTYEIHPFKVRSDTFINYNYIIIDKKTRQSAIIDPAWELDTIVNQLDERDVKPDKILLTHSHEDHTNMVNPLVERYQSQVIMSAAEAEFYAFTSHNLKTIRDLETIALGETTITCLLTPGHTAGGTCYLLSDSLFTGDSVFIEGCGMSLSPGSSPEEMYDSIQRLKQIIDPWVRIYPGHCYVKEAGQPFSYLLENNIYFLLEPKETFVKIRMRKNQKHLYDFK